MPGDEPGWLRNSAKRREAYCFSPILRMSGYDIGASFSSSSGVQGGNVTSGDFIVGGSGGAGKAPTWLLVAAGVFAVIALLAFLLKRRP